MAPHPTPTNHDDQHAKPFAQFLREHGQGRTHDELSDALHALIGRVTDTGKKGSVTLTVSVEPMKKSDAGVVVVTDKITLKLPEHDRPGGVWYVGRDGNLTRNDPNQPELEGLVVVSTETGEVVDTYEAQEKQA